MKTTRWRSPKYLKWIRSLSCAACVEQTARTEAHHIKGVGFFSGLGAKAPDFMTMPLCVHCHRMVHDGVIDARKQWQYLARTQEYFFNACDELKLHELIDCLDCETFD